jgi:hypothetical protein
LHMEQRLTRMSNTFEVPSSSTAVKSHIYVFAFEYMVWHHSRDNQHWHNWRGTVDIWRLILLLRHYGRLNDLIFSVCFSHCEGVMADGAIDVHIIHLGDQKGLRRLVIPRFGFGWIGTAWMAWSAVQTLSELYSSIWFTRRHSMACCSDGCSSQETGARV